LSGFENIITLGHLEAELIILKVLEIHQGAISSLKKNFLSPQIHFWWKP
jgi:hypothetical protein